MNYEAYLNRMKQAAKETYHWYFRVQHILNILDEAKKDFDNISYEEWVRMTKDVKHIIGAVVHENMDYIKSDASVRIEL